MTKQTAENSIFTSSVDTILMIAAVLVAGVVPFTGGTTSPLLYLSAILLPVIWIIRYREKEQLYITSKNLVRSILLGLLAGLGYTALRLALAQLFPSLLASAYELQESAAQLFHVQAITLPVLMALIVPGVIFHNLFYWSFMQSRISRYSKFLIVLIPIFFAIAHIPEGGGSIVQSFLRGSLMSLLLSRTENIAAPIALDAGHLIATLSLIAVGII